MRIVVVPLNLVVCLFACSPQSPAVGAMLTPQVARAVFEHRAHGSDLLRTTVIFPSTPNGVPIAGKHPAVVFVQGGLVGTKRYEWLAERLAAKGYVVALPEHFLDLAIASPDNGRAARTLLVEPPASSLLTGVVDAQRVAVAGHSLGGVVSVKLALAGQFGAVAMLASFPDGADEQALPRLGVPALSLAGQADCSASLVAVRSGAEKLPSPSALVVLEGVTHYQFTDSEAEDVARKCTSGVSLEVAHDRIALALVTFLGHALSASPSTGSAELSALPGSEVVSK